MNRRSFLIGSALTCAAAQTLKLAGQEQIQPIRLSSLTPRLVNQGWGVLQFDQSADGKSLQIGERKFEHGVCTNARSDLAYLVGGEYSRFRGWVGVDAQASPANDATAVFQIFADGQKIFESSVVNRESPAQRVDVIVENVNVLRFIVISAGTRPDRVDWAEAELSANPHSLSHKLTPAKKPLKRLASGKFAFFAAGNSLAGVEMPNGQRIDLQGSTEIGPYVTSGQSSVSDRSAGFHTASGGLTWEGDYRSSSAKPWTAPVDTFFRWPEPTRAKVWLAWGHGNTWEDPLEPRPFENRNYQYGAFFNREGDVSLPMATIIDEQAGVGITFIQSPEDVLLDMHISTTQDGEIRFSRAFHRFGGNSSEVKFHMDIVVHEPDVRAALNAIVERYPSYFDAPNALAGEVGGEGAYSNWEGDLDAKKLAAMGFSMNWKASVDFPYMGMFLPPTTADAQKWNRFAGGGEGDYGPQDEGRFGQTSLHELEAYSAAMRKMGFYVLNYFNVTEFGGNIVYPPPPRKAQADSDLWKEPNDILHGKLENAVLKTPNPTWTWGGGVIMDCGEPAYRDLLLDQARRHIEKLPDSSGICIDRMDWLTRYNPNADDGVTWIDGSYRHLRRSWIALLDALGPMMHSAGKVIFVNDMDRRLELMRQADGIYDEHGYFPHSLNTSAFLALRKPLVCWTADDDTLKPDPDTYLQRHLYLGAFPTAPFPGNDHSILPDEWNEKLYLDYGPLFNAIKARKWLLQPGVCQLEGKGAKINAFETPRGYAIFVGLAGQLERVRLRLRNLGNQAHVLHPGVSDPLALEAAQDGPSAAFDVPLRRGCAMLTITR